MEINDIKNRLSDILSELLTKKFKNNKSELARYIGTNPTSITRYIEKDTYPQADFIFKMCKVLGISPNWFILGIGNKEMDNGGNMKREERTVYQKVGNNNNNITQVMHSNDILHNENESLKRENTLLREMVELYKKQVQK